MQIKIIFLLSLFLFSAVCQNVTNETNETKAVIEHQLEAWVNQDIDGLVSDFAWDAYVLANGTYYQGQNEIRYLFMNAFYSFNYSNCTNNYFGSPFYLNRTAHTTWGMNCSGYTIQVADTFEVENGTIKYMISDSFYVPWSNSSNSSNSSNTTNGTNNTWDIVGRQFLAWAQKDINAIMADYAYDAFVIKQGNLSQAQIIDGYWNVYWVLQDSLYQISACESSFWQTPVVQKNVIYLAWIRCCNGTKLVGTDTLVVNQNGQISSLIVSSTELKHKRNNRRDFFRERENDAE